MKSKNILLTMTIILFFTFINIGCSNNMYSGTYTCNGNSRLTLKLNSDYTFELINSFGKNSECDGGKYTVTDNNIVLEFNNEINIYSFKSLTGKVEGARLNFDKNQLDFNRK